ncbi:hypothetical protein [Cyanobium sp. LEGE 06113]|uniref:hypothetical protein n=1 Tax=Cyanobium sp. LEGE 06113 TaxID=1297573 RepID=UPI001D14E42A|nr:hypothetical protein [Cyanobium sp. LEGE 06113]
MGSPLDNPRHALVRRIIIDLAVMTGIGVFLALSGAFGSMAMPLPMRLLSWVGFAWLGYGFFRPMETVVGWAERTFDLPRWGLWVAGCLISSVPMTVAVLVIGDLPGPVSLPPLDLAMGTYSSVLVIGGAVTLLFNVVQRGPRRAQVARPQPRFRLRLWLRLPLSPALLPPPPLRRRQIPCSTSSRPNSAAPSSRWRWRTTMSACTPRWDRRWC